MIPFLKSIAKAYSSRYSDLSEFCFLFPNKRSSTFFIKYLQELNKDRIILSPEVKTQVEFVGDLAGRVVASRLDLIFLLYESYRELLGVSEEDPEGVEFDSFRGWGETVLSDFSEADQYLVDVESLFKNVKDFREITSNFLTEEQKNVLSEYFGRSDFGDTTGFWKNFDGEEDDLSEVKKKFLHLWRVMYPLYQSLCDKLDSAGLATTGGMYRKGVERLKEEGTGIIPYKKVVAVGFNALNMAENEIFRLLRDSDPREGFDTFADFFWDVTGPVLNDDTNSSSRFVRANQRQFPSPSWAVPFLQESDTNEIPDSIKVASSPSNAAQTKIVGKMLSELQGRLSAEEFKNAKVAVVLPDENLLLPMLYSVPKEVGDVNLTMGYPFRLTSVASFVTLLRLLFGNIRNSRGTVAFYHKDVRRFMAHPYAHILFGTDSVNKLLGYIDRHHKSTVSVEELRAVSLKMEEVLGALAVDMATEQVIDYLDKVLSDIYNEMGEKESGSIKSHLEKSHIELYLNALHRLHDIMKRYEIKMKAVTVFRLVDRLLAGERIGFEGEPLTGLQVMGMLETRSIDFDYIFILSANERILPMRARSRSFIPNTLRNAFGMPPSNYAEEIFAYYFYRMISRAKEVTLIYDARTSGGMRSGDVSRYVLQLRHLFAGSRLIEEDWKFLLSAREASDPSIEKTPHILQKLEAFSADRDGLNFSASSLNAYRECQVKFFYQSVMRINTDPETSEYIDSISAGNILHEMMLQLYVPESDIQKKYLEKPLIITREYLENLIKDKNYIFKILTRTVNRIHYRLPEDRLDTPLSGGAEIVAREIGQQVVSVLRHDLRLAPFKIHGCEISEKIRVKLPSGRVVNFKFAIDRLDEIMVDGVSKLRIVDYKTGAMKLVASDMKEVIEGDYSAEQIFQLFIYAYLLQKTGYQIAKDDVRLEIYNVNKINTDEEFLPKIGEETVKGYQDYSSEFSGLLEEMLDGVFNQPQFKACEDKEMCLRCRLRPICRS